MHVSKSSKETSNDTIKRFLDLSHLCNLPQHPQQTICKTFTTQIKPFRTSLAVALTYRSTCNRLGVTAPGRMTPAPPLTAAPSCTWKTGLSVRPEDCSLVFSTSRGHVTMAPTVPPHL